MTPALTPALALGYLRELSADVRDGVVLGARGELLAGEPALAPPARDALAAMGAAAEAEGRCAEGAAFAARGPDAAIVLVTGAQALDGLVRHDLRLVLADLGAAPAEPPGPAAAVPLEVVKRLCSAAQHAPGG